MNGHDVRTAYGIPGRFRRVPGYPAERHCDRHRPARLYLGGVDSARDIPCLAGWAGGPVRCHVECASGQHRADGPGVLSAVKHCASLHQSSGQGARYLGGKGIMIRIFKEGAVVTGLLVTASWPAAQAALPTPVAPSTAPGSGDWIALIQGYIKDGGLVLGLAIAVLGFLWIAYLGFAKFNEARQGKAEWAEVGVLGIVGAVVLTFASYLLTEAAGVI